MMKAIPTVVNVRKLADKGEILTGVLPIDSFPRAFEALGSLTLDNKVSLVTIRLEFSIDEDGYRIISGNVSAQLPLTCQRCLEPFGQQVDSEFVVALIYSEHQANHLPKQYEPALVSEDDKLSLIELVDEELLLSMPLVASHKQCMQLDSDTGEKPEAERAQETHNPFAVLANMKQ